MVELRDENLKKMEIITANSKLTRFPSRKRFCKSHAKIFPMHWIKTQYKFGGASLNIIAWFFYMFNYS